MTPELREATLQILNSEHRPKFLAMLTGDILLMQRGSYAIGEEPDIDQTRCINECAIVVVSQLRETVLGYGPGEGGGYPDRAFVESFEGTAIAFGGCLGTVASVVHRSIRWIEPSFLLWANGDHTYRGDLRFMQLETDRLILREFHENDWRAMAAYWKDPLYQRFYPERDDFEGFVHELVSRCVAAQAVEPRRTFQLVIERKDDGRLIGNCGVRVNAPENREANIGYELNPAEWGQGFATEAARAIVRFGFEDLGLHRIWAECNAENTGSVRVLTKLGMQREARFRDHKWFRDRWWDTEIYALLEDDWRGGE